MMRLLTSVRACALAAFLAVACLPGGATPTSTLRFERVDAIGADEASVIALLQDKQGYVWIGTNSSGLYRYNGYQALHYTNQPLQPSSLPHDRVSALYQDGKGRIWAGTQDGLARFNPDTNNFARLAPSSGPNNHRIIKQIVGDGRQGMWLATWGGLQHVDPDSGRITQYVHEADKPDSLASNDVNAVAVDDQGGVYAGTWPAGLDYLAPGSRSLRHLRVDDPARPDAKLNIVRALHYDSASKLLWIGTERGVLLWDTRQPWSTRARVSSPDSRVQSFFRDREGGLWAGTLSAGLLHWKKGSRATEVFTHRPIDKYSLQSDNIRAIMQDRGGMLWIGSFTDGISLVNLNSQGFQRFVPFDPTPDNPHPNNSIVAIDGAPGNRLWLGQNTGLSLFDPASGEVLRRWRGGSGPQALANDIVYSLYQQPDGPLWIGTSAGLNRMDTPTSAVRTIHFDSTADDYINWIAPGSQGQLWLGTGVSVIRYDPQTGKHVRYSREAGKPDSRSVNGTTTIVEDRQGRVWMGSDWNGGGLDMLDPKTGKFRHFLHQPGNPDSIADNNVSAIYQDRFGRLWVGTAKGLNELITEPDGRVRFRGFVAGGSVGQVKVLSIRSDKAGMIWLATATGLVRLEPDTGKASRYDANDGLTEGFAIGASFAAPDGTLYFGGVKGMTAAHPANVRALSMPPQVAITDISVYNRSLRDYPAPEGVELEGTVNAPQGLTLAHDQTVVSIEFAAMHYTDPAKNRYAYRLAGFDRNWVETDARHRTATYTNLAPGYYVFEVKAANDQGTWSEYAASLPLRVHPPFWDTWWFRTLASLLVLGSLTLAYKLRVRRLTRQRAALETLVAERTRELEESNRKLATLSTTDGLTSVSNRRGFDIALNSEWRRAKRAGTTVALAMIDVDHFKAYNDHYGHQAGDETLRQIAQVIARHARRTSDMVARYGGEEFAFLAPGTESEQLRQIVEEIGADIRRLGIVHAKAPRMIVTVSAGIAALSPRAGQRIEHLIEQADQALYRAKQDGRDCVRLASTGLSSPR
ncbi:diguanylate cyclase [Massilia sp. TS11]|uniref:ligand-binding sensor domain-containing diguanylate cyclase n=1 Tax=Massilia sp. TS11 TaxID=2908003 RepID=UPI001EDB7E3F|nr:diguanylate cyclase [Massilia sp. TS11]MCG2583611.1 diguanylate cyclase [Massilia sp. TS11]